MAKALQLQERNPHTQQRKYRQAEKLKAIPYPLRLLHGSITAGIDEAPSKEHSEQAA
ncbi:hypothetical protein GCM10011507_06090 [Edaphobacter acidisoli]|uniref:Uncharacterized protein n=1 Tax=Edaphobacter acidisoli TaxID=2040573 RepID=A0A916RHM8_9BACT|nr:hypothetical protein GCM10011507_06090 [Edaphobacter acidisoli]